jgi:hypothetical protein
MIAGWFTGIKLCGNQVIRPSFSFLSNNKCNCLEKGLVYKCYFPLVYTYFLRTTHINIRIFKFEVF